jgi:membrane protein DedA with SNARE-associated domain
MELAESRVIPEHLSVSQTIAFVEKHGYALLFSSVLVEENAIPLPSIPLLLAAGALIRGGRLAGLPAIACCVAALIADAIWFQPGRRCGRRILSLLCRVSLEPDSCVRQTENAFLKYGMKGILIAKFIPELNAVAAPLAGNSRSPFARFLLYDAAGVTWSGAYILLGFLFSAAIGGAFGLRFDDGIGIAAAGRSALRPLDWPQVRPAASVPEAAERRPHHAEGTVGAAGGRRTHGDRRFA